MPPPSSNPQLAAELRGVYFFASLDEPQFQRVLEAAHVVTLEIDQSLFEQGQVAERFFLLRRGLVKLSRLSPAGEEKVIEFVQRGQTFAEALMFTGKPASYPVTARALEPSEIIGFDNRIFLALLRDSPETCLRLLAGMSKRMHGLIDEIDRLALQSATSRLVGFLIAGAEGDQVELRTPKHVLASRLSIKPETLSRIFARLASDGLIRVHGAHIELLQVEDLRRLAEPGLL